MLTLGTTLSLLAVSTLLLLLSSGVRSRLSVHFRRVFPRSGSVVSVAISSGHTFSKQACSSIELERGLGIKGDAHFGAQVQHRSRVAVDPAQPNLRQVHLLHSELLDDELPSQGFKLVPGELGENILTRGIDLLHLPTHTMLYLGSDAIVLLTGLRNPCDQIESHRSGLLARLLVSDKTQQDVPLQRKAGVMAIVLQSGTVKAGDRIRVELPPLPHQPMERV
jgi:MOSC domain-containing protein YiiM